MASKALLILVILLVWASAVQALDPPVLAITAASDSTGPGNLAIGNRAGLAPVIHSRTISPEAPADRREAPRGHPPGPLPATIGVILAGLLTAVIMQTRR